jgi:hypothetical protein
MAPAASPDERMLVLIPVGGGAFNGLLDLGPGLEPFKASDFRIFHQGSIRLR